MSLDHNGSDPLREKVASLLLEIINSWKGATMPEWAKLKNTAERAFLLKDTDRLIDAIKGIDPPQDQGKGSDGSEASPLRKAAEEVIKRAMNSGLEYAYKHIKDGLTPKYECPRCRGGGCEYCAERGWFYHWLPALSGERSEPSNPIPSPKPLETAEAVISGYHCVEYIGINAGFQFAADLIASLKSHGYEITRSGGRES